MKRNDGLSRRQIDVLRLYGDGMCTKQIAGKLYISEKTVEYHKAQVLKIMNLKSFAQLVKLAVGFGLTALCLTFAVQAQAFLTPSNPPPQVMLAWNPVTGATNYNVYVGVGSRQYTNATLSGGLTNATITLPARGVAFFFAVTTKANGLESQFSNEVTYTAPSPPAAPIMQPLVVLTVQVAPTVNGMFADTGMNWSVSPDQGLQAYRLRIARGFVTASTGPPLPSGLTIKR